MRVGVVDIGTNSTRLLVADVGNGVVTEVDRRTEVTRLGQGVDATGRLAEEAMGRVFATLAIYRSAIDHHGCEATTAVLTSAVRDAANGAEFTRAVSEQYGLEARTISGDEEAALTFLGATSTRPPGGPSPLVVVDIGGGSTELVIGEAGAVAFHVSLQAGVVRQTERHLHTDPPPPEETQDLADDVRAIIAAGVPTERASEPQAAIGVAGTATSAAAIDQALEPYDPDRVHGHVVSLGRLEQMLAALAAIPLEERRQIAGLHPDRAPTIVAGMVILVEVLRAFDLETVEISERDILHGAALRLAG